MVQVIYTEGTAALQSMWVLHKLHAEDASSVYNPLNNNNNNNNDNNKEYIAFPPKNIMIVN